MGTPLGQQTATIPSIKLRTIGDYVDVALVDLAEVPWTEFGTGAAKIGKDGKPRKQDRIVALVIGGSAVVTGDDKSDRPVAADELVSIYAAGHRRWEWIQAQKALDGGVQVGDVMRVKYARDEAGQTTSNPKKVWEFKLRHPKPEEAARSARCEELRRSANATPLTDGGDQQYGDDEPF